MRKFGFTALVSFLFLLASCMNMEGSSGEDGAIRVALPGSGSRGAYTLSKENAKTYKVALLLDGENLKTQTSEAGGGADIVFDELEPATYTVQVEAYDTTDVLLARKSETIKVTAGETAECSIALKLFASSILDSGYILWKYSSNSYDYYRNSSISEDAENLCHFYGDLTGAAEDLNENWYCLSKSDGGPASLYRWNGNSNKVLKNNFDSDFSFLSDPLYYDDTTDTLWLAGHNSSSDFCLSKNAAPSSIASIATINKVNGFDTNGGLRTCVAFAIRESDIYIAYEDMDSDSNLVYCLQHGKISGDGPFVFEPIGSPKTVSDLDLDVSGAITDVAILYDGTVYVLVSNVGNSLGDSGDSFIYNYNQSNTMYSRGALLKIQSTDSGFEVVDTLGWTGSSRPIAPDGDAQYTDVTGTGSKLDPLTAYIPSLSENSNKFYGPRRFVAIKPKEIAIADCGANFVMPNCNEGQNGKMFAHNRVVTVSLSSFAISGATKLEKIKFSDLTLDGSGISGAWILADGCDKLQNEQ